MSKIAYIQASDGWPHLHIDQAIQRALVQLGVTTGIYRPEELPRRLHEFTPGAWDLILVLHGAAVPPEVTDHWRAVGIPTALWLIEDPYEIDVELGRSPRYDLVFTIEEGCLEAHRRAGARAVYYLPLAVDDSIFRPQGQSGPFTADITLVGVGFANRRRVLEAAAPGLAGLSVRLVGPHWEGVGAAAGLNPVWRAEIIPPAEAARYYGAARINLNIHRSADDPTFNLNQQGWPGWSPNNRLFEIAAVGGFILSDYRPGLGSAFELDRELVTFQSPEELVAKARFYLSRSDLRAEIGNRARQRVLVQHTYRHRLMEILSRAGVALKPSPFAGVPSFSYWQPKGQKRGTFPTAGGGNATAGQGSKPHPFDSGQAFHFWQPKGTNRGALSDADGSYRFWRPTR